MKKKLLIPVCLSLLSLGLAACDDDNPSSTPEPSVPAHSHSWESAWQHDDSNHWHKCTDATCEEVDSKTSVLDKKNYLVINIIDEGVEIKEENIDKIFNKFYQVDGSEFTEGNGIGLSIVKHIVELHNGKIIASSKNNKTTFTLELPKH